jgi:hypothetical protein
MSVRSWLFRDIDQRIYIFKSNRICNFYTLHKVCTSCKSSTFSHLPEHFPLWWTIRNTLEMIYEWAYIHIDRLSSINSFVSAMHKYQGYLNTENRKETFWVRAWIILFIYLYFSFQYSHFVSGSTESSEHNKQEYGSKLKVKPKSRSV